MKKLFITEEQYNRLVNHIYQPDGISCGPTCIKMVGDFFKGEVSSIEDICKSCGTDNITGTPPERMRKGLDSLDIQYIEHIGEENPYQSLRDAIDKGSVCLLRTFTHKVPHWILVHSYKDDVFNVNDPWLGMLQYNEVQLDEIWRGREHFFFEVIKENGKMEIDEEEQSEVIIRPYTNKDEESIIQMLEDVYSKLPTLSATTIWSMIKAECGGLFGLSVVAEVNGQVAGFYFIIPNDLPMKEGQDITDDMIGIQGVALGVSSKYKSLGIGKKLIEYPQTIGADYIWGFQFKQLENINDWLKRRKIYSETDNMYTTYQIFNNNG